MADKSASTSLGEEITEYNQALCNAANFYAELDASLNLDEIKSMVSDALKENTPQAQEWGDSPEPVECLPLATGLPTHPGIIAWGDSPSGFNPYDDWEDC